MKENCYLEGNDVVWILDSSQIHGSELSFTQRTADLEVSDGELPGRLIMLIARQSEI